MRELKNVVDCSLPTKRAGIEYPANNIGNMVFCHRISRLYKQSNNWDNRWLTQWESPNIICKYEYIFPPFNQYTIYFVLVTLLYRNYYDYDLLTNWNNFTSCWVLCLIKTGQCYVGIIVIFRLSPKQRKSVLTNR